MSHRKVILLVFLISFSVIVSGCGLLDEQREITIGGKADTESEVLANLAGQLLEAEGFEVERELGMQSVLVRQALETDEVDFYYEYTGTAYTLYHEEEDQDIMTDSQEVYEWVREADEEENIIWLDRLDYNNTYTVMLRQEDAEEWGVESISDLAAEQDELDLEFATDTEFYERPDGFYALTEAYGLEFADVSRMSAGIIYEALQEGQIDSGTGYSTDGRIEAFGLVNLEDDQDFFPVYNPAPTIRADVLEEYPEIEEILKPLAENLSEEEVREMNGQVDIEHREAEDVTEEWLEDNGLL